jgi:hypothetical protein
MSIRRASFFNSNLAWSYFEVLTVVFITYGVWDVISGSL